MLVWWRHEVDETNGQGKPAKLQVLEEAVYETCNLGHLHRMKEPIYVIPVKKEGDE